MNVVKSRAREVEVVIVSPLLRGMKVEKKDRSAECTVGSGCAANALSARDRLSAQAKAGTTETMDADSRTRRTPGDEMRNQ